MELELDLPFIRSTVKWADIKDGPLSVEEAQIIADFYIEINTRPHQPRKTAVPDFKEGKSRDAVTPKKKKKKAKKTKTAPCDPAAAGTTTIASNNNDNNSKKKKKQKQGPRKTTEKARVDGDEEERVLQEAIERANKERDEAKGKSTQSEELQTLLWRHGKQVDAIQREREEIERLRQRLIDDIHTHNIDKDDARLSQKRATKLLEEQNQAINDLYMAVIRLWKKEYGDPTDWVDFNKLQAFVRAESFPTEEHRRAVDERLTALEVSATQTTMMARYHLFAATSALDQTLSTIDELVTERKLAPHNALRLRQNMAAPFRPMKNPGEFETTSERLRDLVDRAYGESVFAFLTKADEENFDKEFFEVATDFVGGGGGDCKQTDQPQVGRPVGEVDDSWEFTVVTGGEHE